MKLSLSLRLPFLARSFAFLVTPAWLAACGATVDPTTQVVPPTATTIAPAPAATTPPAPPAPKKTARCTPPLDVRTCNPVGPEPKTSSAVKAFYQADAIPIRCNEGDAAVWDLQPLLELSDDARIVMLGEVHGSNEIGIVSEVLLRTLAAAGRVSVVAYELPMDYEASLQRYVDGKDDTLARMLVDQVAPNFFGARLTRAARELVANGATLTIAAVDIPTEPRSAVLAIEGVAAQLTTKKSLVLATLPQGASVPASPSDIDAANGYFDHIMAKKDEICSELTSEACERLVAMTHALWASTVTYDDVSDPTLWFERREPVIYYNLKSKMASASDRMLLHMGAAHTRKDSFSAGSRMAKDYAPTRGKVFSVAPAYGDGSVIWYGEEVDLPAEPLSLVAALGHAPAQPSFMSTIRPSATCAANPLGRESDAEGGGTRAESYDGYVHYGRLTPETRPKETTFEAELPLVGASEGRSAQRLLRFHERIQQKERAARAFAMAEGARVRVR